MEYERHLAKLQAIGYREGLFKGLQSADKEAAISDGYVLGAKVGVFLRVLVEVYYERFHENNERPMVHDDVHVESEEEQRPLISTSCLKQLLDVHHAFHPTKVNFDVEKIRGWDVLRDLQAILDDKEKGAGKTCLKEEEDGIVAHLCRCSPVLEQLVAQLVEP